MPLLKLISSGKYIGHIRIFPEANIQQTNGTGIDFLFNRAILVREQFDPGTFGLYAIRVDGDISANWFQKSNAKLIPVIRF